MTGVHLLALGRTTTTTLSPVLAALLATLSLAGCLGTFGWLGEKRVEALQRIGAAIWMLVVGLVWSVLSLIVLGFTLIDLIWQFVFNSDGFDAEGRAAQWIQGFFAWRAAISSFVFTGEDTFEWWPSPGNGL